MRSTLKKVEIEGYGLLNPPKEIQNYDKDGDGTISVHMRDKKDFYDKPSAIEKTSMLTDNKSISPQGIGAPII